MARLGRPKKNVNEEPFKEKNIKKEKKLVLEKNVSKNNQLKSKDISNESMKKSKNIDKKEYFIVDKRILPNSIKNVLKVNDLVQNEKISKYEAIKQVGLSRSTYYKYKDYIKPFFEGGQEKVFSIHLALKDEPGILARILDVIASHDMNILTIIQNISIDGVGRATISVQTTQNTLRKVEGVLELISEIDGVKELRIIGSN